MHAIKYEAPKTLKDAVALLAQHGEKARPLCGGTDLIIQLRAGVRRPDHVVDIKKIPESAQLSFDAKKGLAAGRGGPGIEIYENADAQRHYPGLIEAAHLIGSTQIQSRASVGGNLCNGSPAADTTPALIALGARARVAGPKGEREVPVEDFCTAPGRTVLAAGRVAGRDSDRRAQAAFAPTPTCASSRATRWTSRWSASARALHAGRRQGERRADQRWARWPRRRCSRAKAAESLVGKKLDDAAIERAAQLAIEAELADRRHARHGRVPPPPGRRADQAHVAYRGRTRAQGKRNATTSSTNRQNQRITARHRQGQKQCRNDHQR